MISTAPSMATDDVVSIAGMKNSWHASKQRSHGGDRGVSRRLPMMANGSRIGGVGKMGEVSSPR